MIILVTGSSGYIASNFIRRINESSSHMVIGLTRRSTGYEHANYQEVITDLSQDDFTDYIPDNVSVDIVCQFVQSSRYREFPEGAKDMFEVNINSTFQLLEWSRKNKVKKFIHSSTGNVYSPSNETIKEEYECNPNSFYGASKICAETIVSQYTSIFDVKILRIFGVYGPNQKNMIIPNIISRVKEGKEVTLANGLGLVYTPLYIKDCLNMLEIILQDTTSNNVYNFAGNEEVSLKDVVNEISACLKIEPNFIETKGKETCLIGDINLFIETHNYIPSTTIKEGIRIILE